jgi:LacI family transcriptional regulator
MEPMATRITIRDIARLAGVSKSTVSRVLNRSTNVAPEIRERVVRIMQEQGFVPSVAATQLARGQNRLIGMLIEPTLTWPLIPAIIQGVAQVIESTPYEIVLYNSHAGEDYGQMIDRVLATNLSAGIVAVLHDQSPQHLIELHDHGLPVVIVNTTAARMKIPSVTADNIGGAYMAVRHLIELGHTRIGCALGLINLPCIDERYEGYCKALAEAGIELDPMLVLRTEFAPAGGADATRRFFAMAERPTAIFACNDAMAYGVLAAAEELGWHIPTELAVIGFDDNAFSALVRPPLTTIHQPFEEMGQSAAEMLLTLINQQQHLFSHEESTQSTLETHLLSPQDHEQSLHIQLLTRLVIRDSCGAVRKGIFPYTKQLEQQIT